MDIMVLRILSASFIWVDSVASGFLLLCNCLCNLVGVFLLCFSVSRCAGQCILFGKVLEVQRIQIGGSRAWCFFCIIMCVFNTFTSAVLFKCGKSRKTKFVTDYRTAIMLVGLLLTFFTACIVSLGFRQWCASFQINSCIVNSGQDWNAFTPKYSDCFGAFYWLVIITAVMWCSFLCQSCLLIQHKWKKDATCMSTVKRNIFID